MLERDGRRLLRLGVVLVLVGLFTGLAIPALAVPRLGLSAHISGVLGGLVLIVLGLLWPKLRLGARASGAGLVVALYAFTVAWAMPRVPPEGCSTASS
jgi:(hydroxyamino)benzene mutase